MPKFFYSICAIVKNESEYIREWVTFNYLQGCQHIFLYHNADCSEDLETFEVIKSYVDSGYITYIPWPGVKQQCVAYQHCLDTHGLDSEFIFFGDTDEFLWAPDQSIYKTVADQLLYEYTSEVIGVIAVHWFLFGSNDHKEKTDGLVIERFTKRAATVNHHVKSIVRPIAVKAAGKNPHAFYLENGFKAINERGESLPVEYALTENGSADVLRINHYHVKSREEYRNRKSNPDPNSAKTFTPEEIEEKFLAHDVNEVHDTEVRDLYAEKIKAKL